MEIGEKGMAPATRDPSYLLLVSQGRVRGQDIPQAYWAPQLPRWREARQAEERTQVCFRCCRRCLPYPLGQARRLPSPPAEGAERAERQYGSQRQAEEIEEAHGRGSSCRRS